MSDTHHMTSAMFHKIIDDTCSAHKIQRAAQYAEPQAAMFWGVDYTTAKRWRKKGLVRAIQKGDRGVAYTGYEIAKVLAFGTGETWADTQNETSNSAIGSSERSPALQPGTVVSMTNGPDRQSVTALANSTFSAPKKN